MSLDTLKPKVRKLIEIALNAEGGGDDFIGVKYSNYDTAPNGYNLPKTADARSLDKVLGDPNSIALKIRQAENDQCLAYMFANATKNANGGYFNKLEEVYLPSKATSLTFTFQNCPNLKRVYGDLSNIHGFGTGAFDNCISLTEFPNVPNLLSINNTAFRGCTGLTEITFPNTVTSIHSGAFTGCTNVTDVFCPWAEGTVANAPWGMTNATIHYNVEV
jgi:hypothetical protein